MPLTYHDVMTTQLHMLVDAAKAWEKMGNRFGELKTNFDDNVLKVTGDGSWRGEGFQAATSASGVIKHEYSAAKAEALAIAEILHEAYTQFRDFKQAIDKVVKDAESKGYKVSATGEVTFDWESLTPEENRAMKNDPGLIAKAENDIANSIKKLVRDVDDADNGVKLALNAAVTDQDGKGDAHGFNSAAEGDMEKVEAKRASQLATKLNSEGDLPAGLRAEMSVLMRDNSGDKAFSRTLLDDLGPKTTLQVSNRFAEQAHGGNKEYGNLDKSLALALATATKDTDTPFYEKWRKDMRTVGPEMISGGDKPANGYQSLVTLMKQGSGYSRQFQYDVGNDIIAAEKKNPELWNDARSSQKALYPDNYKWLEEDPLDGLLGVMGRDPKSAEYFLDPAPGTGHENQHLKYLLTEREWDKTFHFEGGSGSDHAEVDVDIKDPDARKGLGGALEAAATGNMPGSTPESIGGHSEEQARVMHDTIKYLNEDNSGDKLPVNLRAPVGHMLRDFTPDTHEILSRTNEDYKELGAAGGVFRDEDNGAVRMAVHKDDLARVMRGVAEDPAAYGDMYNAERQYAADTLASHPIEGGNRDDRDALVENSSSVFGFYDGVSSDIAFDKRDASVQWARDVNHHVTASTGAALNFVPAKWGAGAAGMGDIGNRITDFGMYDWTKDQIAEANKSAAEENRYEFNTGQRQVDKLVVRWGEVQGLDNNDGTVRHLVGAGQERHDSAREEALRALDRDK